MYAFPNATIWCGSPIPGGGPCVNCPDEMPPSWEVTGVFGNGECDFCDDFDGLAFPGTGCNRGVFSHAPCYAPDGPSEIDHFLSFGTGGDPLRIELILQVPFGPTSGGQAIYRKTRSEGESCNKAHTLMKFQNAPGCDWPESVTISPTE